MDHWDKDRKAIEAVRVGAVPGGLSEQMRAPRDVIAFEAELQQCSQKSIEKLGIGHSTQNFQITVV